MRLTIRLAWYKAKEKVPMWIAWHLPRAVVSWCAIRVVAHATGGRHNLQAHDLRAMEAIKLWDSEDFTLRWPK